MTCTLNLATRSYYNRRKFRLMLYGLLLLMAAAGLAGVSYGLSLHRQLSKIATEQSGQKTLARVKPDIPIQEQKLHSARITAFNRILSRRNHSFCELLDHLEESTPNGISYTLVSPEPKEKGGIRLEGNVGTMQTLSQLLKNLESNKSLPFPRLISTEDRLPQTAPDSSQGIGFVILLGGVL